MNALDLSLKGAVALLAVGVSAHSVGEQDVAELAAQLALASVGVGIAVEVVDVEDDGDE
jgi:hypothetical protein